MRALLCLILLASTASADDVCKSSVDCEKACGGKKTAACTFAAEMHFDGKAGWALDHKKSLRFAKRACDAKDAFGCALVGLHHQDGLGTPFAPAKAIAAYEKACAGGAGVGCFNLASMYLGAHGIPFDRTKGDAFMKQARTHWEAACNGTAPRWCTNLAFLDAPDTKASADKQANALKLNTRACDAGVTVGCLEAARARLELGKLDAAGFVKELEALCTKGELGACSVLGALYSLGEKGIPTDGKRAVQLFTSACDGGDKHSCFALGIEYASGKNVKQDFAATTRAFDRACDRALSKACLAIAQDLAARREFKRAADYARRGCHMGNGEGCGILAQLHTDGSGVAKSTSESTTWATEGCRMGHMPSCGILVKRDVFPLPVPAEQQKRLWETACVEGKLESACKRFQKMK
jgi:TPR repeat protein